MSTNNAAATSTAAVATKKRSAEEACRDMELLFGDAKRAMVDLSDKDAAAVPHMERIDRLRHLAALRTGVTTFETPLLAAEASAAAETQYRADVIERYPGAAMLPKELNLMALPLDALKIIVKRLSFKDALALSGTCLDLLKVVRKNRFGYVRMRHYISFEAAKLQLIARYCDIRDKSKNDSRITPIDTDWVNVGINADILTTDTAISLRLLLRLVGNMKCLIYIDVTRNWPAQCTLPHVGLVAPGNIVTPMAPNIFSLPNQQLIIHSRECTQILDEPYYIAHTNVCLYNGAAFTLCYPSAKHLIVLGPMPRNGPNPTASAPCLADVILAAKLQQLVVTDDECNIDNLIDIVPVLCTLSKLFLIRIRSTNPPARTDQLLRLLTALRKHGATTTTEVVLPIPSCQVLDRHKVSYTESYGSTMLSAFPTAKFCLAGYQTTRIFATKLRDDADDPVLEEVINANDALQYESNPINGALTCINDADRRLLLARAAALLANKKP